MIRLGNLGFSFTNSTGVPYGRVREDLSGSTNIYVIERSGERQRLIVPKSGQHVSARNFHEK